MRLPKTSGMSACVCAFALAAFGVMSARAEDVVAKIGEAEYTDLQTAFNEVKAGETIVLASDVTNKNITAATYLTFASGKQATLDLNGKTVYGENSLKVNSAMLTVAGDLTIDDTSAEKSGRFVVKPLCPASYEELETGGYGSHLILIKGGSLTLDGGTIENLGDGPACYAFEMGEYAAGTLTVNGGVARATAQASAVRMYSHADAPALSVAVNGGLLESIRGAGIQYFAPGGGGKAAIAISGGEVRGQDYGIYVYDTLGGVTVDMTGGTVTAARSNGSAIYVYNSKPRAFEQTKVNLSGGTVSGAIALSVVDYYAATQTTISGGDFSGKMYVYTCDCSYNGGTGYWRTDDYCIRVTEGSPSNFSNFGMANNSDSWFYWSDQSGVLLYGGTYDKCISTGKDYAGRVAEGYCYRDNFNGTWTVVRGWVVDGVSCALQDEDTVAPGEKPAGTKDEVWDAATNIVATVATAYAPNIVADIELTNAVNAAKAQCGENETVMTILANVEVVVTPTGAEADANDQIRMVTIDVTPRLTTWAVVTNGVTATTNQVGDASRSFAYSGWPMTISFNVANMAGEPMLVIHRHDTYEYRYTRGSEATGSTFAYDAEAATVTLLMSEFSEIEIRSDIQVGDAAFARIGTDGVCTIVGTGDMWSYDKAGKSPIEDYKGVITNVVVSDGVTGVGSRFFENMWCLADVTLGADVTNVAARAFKKCYGLTNVTSVATGTLAVGDYVFSGCHSLQAMSFGNAATFGTECYSLQAAIYMRDGVPEVYPIPKVTIAGKTERLWATNTLGDESSWTDVTDATPEERKAYHFFKLKMQ